MRGIPAEKVLDGAIFTALILFALASPLSISITNISLGLALLFIVIHFIYFRGERGPLDMLSLVIILFLAVDFVAVLLSKYQINLRSYVEERWIVMAYFASFYGVKRNDQIQKIFEALIYSSLIAALYAFVQHFSGFDYLHGEPLRVHAYGVEAEGFFTHHLTYGGHVMMVFLMTLAVGVFHPTVKKKLLFGIFTGLLGLALLWSYARSAWIGAFGGILALGLFLPKGYRWKIWLTLALMAGLLLIFQPSIRTRITQSFTTETQQARLNLWRTSLRIIKSRPLLGIGMANWGEAFKEFSVDGYYMSTCHPHNDFLNEAVISGLVGLASFLLIWFFFFRKALLVLPKIKDRGIDWALAVGGTISLIAILVAGFFQNYQTDAENGLLVWFILGLTARFSQNLDETE